MSFALNLAEKNLLPDWLIRIGIRKLLKDRIFEICSDSYENQQKNKIPLPVSPATTCPIPGTKNEATPARVGS